MSFAAPHDRHDAGGFWPRTVPAVSILVLSVVGLVPLGLPGWPTVGPMLSVLAVYFWAIDRPEMIPAWLLFGLGTAQDLLTDGPMGLTPMAMLLIAWVVTGQRRVFLGKPFQIAWWGLAVAMTVVVVVYWTVGSLYYLVPLHPLPFLAQWLGTIALYPAVALVLGRVGHALLPED